VLVYCIATLVAFFRRIAQLATTDYNDPGIIYDPTMGVSVILPMLALVQSFVMLSTPAVMRFWRKDVLARITGQTVT